MINIEQLLMFSNSTNDLVGYLHLAFWAILIDFQHSIDLHEFALNCYVSTRFD